MTQNYGKNPKIARNETKFNNTKKWRNRLDYTTFLIDSYFLLIVVFGELFNLLEVGVLDVFILWGALLLSLLLTGKWVALRTSLSTLGVLVHLL